MAEEKGSIETNTAVCGPVISPNREVNLNSNEGQPRVGEFFFINHEVEVDNVSLSSMSSDPTAYTETEIVENHGDYPLTVNYALSITASSANSSVSSVKFKSGGIPTAFRRKAYDHSTSGDEDALPGNIPKTWSKDPALNRSTDPTIDLENRPSHEESSYDISADEESVLSKGNSSTSSFSDGFGGYIYQNFSELNPRMAKLFILTASMLLLFGVSAVIAAIIVDGNPAKSGADYKQLTSLYDSPTVGISSTSTSGEAPETAVDPSIGSTPTIPIDTATLLQVATTAAPSTAQSTVPSIAPSTAQSTAPSTAPSTVPSTVPSARDESNDESLEWIFTDTTTSETTTLTVDPSTDATTSSTVTTSSSSSTAATTSATTSSSSTTSSSTVASSSTSSTSTTTSTTTVKPSTTSSSTVTTSSSTSSTSTTTSTNTVKPSTTSSSKVASSSTSSTSTTTSTNTVQPSTTSSSKVASSSTSSTSTTTSTTTVKPSTTSSPSKLSATYIQAVANSFLVEGKAGNEDVDMENDKDKDKDKDKDNDKNEAKNDVVNNFVNIGTIVRFDILPMLNDPRGTPFKVFMRPGSNNEDFEEISLDYLPKAGLWECSPCERAQISLDNSVAVGTFDRNGFVDIAPAFSRGIFDNKMTFKLNSTEMLPAPELVLLWVEGNVNDFADLSAASLMEMISEDEDLFQ